MRSIRMFPIPPRRPGTRLERRRRAGLSPRGEPLEARALLSVGGGYTAAGLTGAYYPDAALSGAPAFTRQDDRVDFDWGTKGLDVGGSNSPGFNAVGATQFSVKWTGQVIPKFSETYQLITTSEDGVRLFIRPSGSTTWTTVIDDWTPHSTQDDAGSYAMTAGQAYDVEMDYYQGTGPTAVARLSWSSASTPREVIDPASIAGVNADTYDLQIFADAMKTARTTWDNATGAGNLPAVTVDANDWPTSDANKVVWEGRDPASMAGTYLLQFNGKAVVTTGFNLGKFAAGGVTYGNILPSGAGYNPATNTTTATMTVGSVGTLNLTFTQTQRTAVSATGTGLTNIAVMKPTSAGASTYYPAGTLFDANEKANLSVFTAERWLTANFNTTEVNWSDRILPTFAQAVNSRQDASWEYEVMLANETGKDLYITIPVNATMAYVTNLADLIRYGSDGVNPYTGAQANPTYPGLNPNLKVYVEWSSEIWNWAFPQSAAAVANAKAAVQNNTPDGQIINFDGKYPGGDFRRWEALMLEQTSVIFRSVFGDAAMGDQVRILLEYQYVDGQGTATSALSFLDNYFNNADGIQHVAVPHPVNYYLWGAGGGTYYGAVNTNGTQTAVNFTDPSFEANGVAPGTAVADPTGTAYTYSGNAGLYSDPVLKSATTPRAAGTLGNSTGGSQEFGYSFTVGSQALNIYDLGRWVVTGNSQSHTVTIVRASDLAQIAQATVNTSGAVAGKYLYATLSGPITLTANTTYYLLSSETNGGDDFYGQNTQISSTSGITLNGAMSAVAAQWSSPSSWTFTSGTAGNHTFVGVDFQYAPAPVGNLGFVPDAPSGAQAAFIGDTGSISQAVNFPAAGVFALQLSVADKTNAADPIQVYVDGVPATPNSNGTSYLPSSTPWTPGQYLFGVNQWQFNALQTAPFTISTPGLHTIKIVGVGAAGQYDFFDSMTILSEDAIFTGGLPAPKTIGNKTVSYATYLADEADYAQAYGLQVVAYEGGWSVGFNSGGSPLQNYAKYVDPRAAQVNITSYDDFAQAGGALVFFGSYEQWPLDATDNAAQYPLESSIVTAGNQLPPDPTNGLVLPTALSLANATLISNINGRNLYPDSYVTWNVIVGQTASYNIAVTTNAGGPLLLSVDEGTVASGSGSTISGSILMTKGLHTIKVQNFAKIVAIIGIVVGPPGS